MSMPNRAANCERKIWPCWASEDSTQSAPRARRAAEKSNKSRGVWFSRSEAVSFSEKQMIPCLNFGHFCDRRFATTITSVNRGTGVG